MDTLGGSPRGTTPRATTGTKTPTTTDRPKY
jgi:hypothetical protein